jgi:membrane protease YdiL (CAAX protease family)
MLANLVGILFVSLLLAGVPALSLLTVRRIQVHLVTRYELYVSAVISQWFLAVVGIVVVFISGPGFGAAGFRPIPTPTFLRWTFLLAGVSLAALGLVLLLERRGWWPEEPELVRLLMPETRLEKLAAVLLLAPTAALCEEFLYRGYLLVELSQWAGSMRWAWVLSSVAFGLAHAYQGLNGMVRAALLGGLLAYPVIRLGSLYPSMAAHFLIDALALAWLGPAFLRRNQSA